MVSKIKNFKFIFLIFILIFLDSCVTYGLWYSTLNTESNRFYKVEKYRDGVIKDILVNEEGAEVIIVESKRNYLIKDTNKTIKEISQAALESNVSLDFYGLMVLNKGKEKKSHISFIFVKETKDLSKEQINILTSHSARIKPHISNYRYIGNEVVVFEFSQTHIDKISNDKITLKNFVSTGLIKDHQRIHVTEYPLNTIPVIAGKMLLTPFSLVADVVVTPLLLIFLKLVEFC